MTGHVTELLLREVQPDLDRLAERSVSRGLREHNLTDGERASFLRALHVLHDDVTRSLRADESEHSVLAVALLEGQRAALERELHQLAVEVHHADAAALRALRLGQAVRLAPAGDEGAPWGALWALDAVTEWVCAPRAPARAQVLHEGLNIQRSAVRTVDGARRVVEGLAGVLDAIETPPAPVAHLLGELNPAAGTHVMPEDLREIRAAFLAGEETWRAFAYYEARYGERGQRFTRSDSAWLVTLCRSKHEHALRHVLWLGSLLAARGMPRLLLEHHLLSLHQHLVREVPERSSQYQSLVALAQDLCVMRLRAVPLDVEDACRAAFELAVPGAEAGISPREGARLLLGAVADERHGLPGALESLRAFCGDVSRFSPRWIEAQDTLLRLCAQRLPRREESAASDSVA